MINVHMYVSLSCLNASFTSLCYDLTNSFIFFFLGRDTGILSYLGHQIPLLLCPARLNHSVDVNSPQEKALDVCLASLGQQAWDFRLC